MADEITLGELARRLGDFKADVKDQFADTRRQIEGLKFVSNEKFDGAMHGIEERFKGVERSQSRMEDSKTWLVRSMFLLVMSNAVAVIGTLIVTQ